MKLNFIKPKNVQASAKLTAHKTGKLGLSKGAAELLKVNDFRFAKFGTDEGGQLYLLMVDKEDEETFYIASAGAYYNISAKSLLEDLEVDYTAPETTIFDIRSTENDQVYRLTKRVLKARK